MFKERNFYVPYLFDGDDISYVDKLHAGGAIVVFRPSGSQTVETAEIDDAELMRRQMRIKHHFREIILTYRSTGSFLLRHYTGFNYLVLVLDRLKRIVYARRRLQRDRRYSILKLITEWSLRDQHFKVSSVEFLTAKLGSSAWYHFKDREENIVYYRKMLDSLVDSGELTKHSISYSVTPKAYATVANYERDEQRHKDMLKTQRRLSWLTAGLIFVGLMQIDDVRNPVLWVFGQIIDRLSHLLYWFSSIL